MGLGIPMEWYPQQPVLGLTEFFLRSVLYLVQSMRHVPAPSDVKDISMNWPREHGTGSSRPPDAQAARCFRVVQWHNNISSANTWHSILKKFISILSRATEVNWHWISHEKRSDNSHSPNTHLEFLDILSSFNLDAWKMRDGHCMPCKFRTVLAIDSRLWRQVSGCQQMPGRLSAPKTANHLPRPCPDAQSKSVRFPTFSKIAIYTHTQLTKLW
jgi:hypothetical protein